LFLHNNLVEKSEKKRHDASLKKPLAQFKKKKEEAKQARSTSPVRFMSKSTSD